MDDETIKKLLSEITAISKDQDKCDQFMRKYKTIVFESAIVTEKHKNHLATVFGAMLIGYSLAKLEGKYIN